MNKELRETSEEKTKEISELTSTNQNLSVIIDDLTELNNDLEKENRLLWSEKKTENSESTIEGLTDCSCCCGDLEECNCSCNCSCHE